MWHNALHLSLLTPCCGTTDPWVIPTSQVLVGGPGWKPPLDFFDFNSQGLSHPGKLGLADPCCGNVMARVLEEGRRQMKSQVSQVGGSCGFMGSVLLSHFPSPPLLLLWQNQYHLQAP